jgi:archaellin
VRWRRRRKNRFVIAAIVAAVVALAAYAVTATNTVPATNAGSGSGAISGYTVSSVAYTLNATNPQNVDQVAFTISPTTGTVKVQLVSGGSWYSCTNSGGSVTCATTSPQATAASINQLTVVAAQ